MPDTPIVIVSNRGPVSFSIDDGGRAVARRGSGGLASGLRSLGERSDARWVAAAIGDGDRRVADEGDTDAEGFRLRLLKIDPEVYKQYYDVISNETLWFLHHDLWDHAREPRFDHHWHVAWESYRAVNRAFADSVSDWAPPGSVVLVQDYHLALVGRLLADLRPDLRTVHFHHTPFCGPEELDVLPTGVVAELLDGLAGFGSCGFHTTRWVTDYRSCANRFGAGAPPTFAAPLAADPEDLVEAAADPECGLELGSLEERIGDRLFLARVDRIELSKNLLRGFDAFDFLLERSPRWRGRVVFGAFCYPSREGVPAYSRYRAEVLKRAEELNSRWGTPDWLPLMLETDDRYPRSIAALRRSDVLLVNPIRDGLNLVAKEGALLNERHGSLVLSTRAGSWEELGEASDGVNPFDVHETSLAIEAALERSPAEREVQAGRRRALAAARTPEDWLADQLAASVAG